MIDATVESEKVMTNTRALQITAVLIGLALACTPLQRADEPEAAAAPVEESHSIRLEHLVPPPDFVGTVPLRLEWTPVVGADEYALGLWNDVDVLVWRLANVPTASISLSADFHLEPGTYFWSVTALHEKRPLAYSGRAAFVVR